MEDPNLDPTVALAALDLEIGLIEETRQKMVAGTGRWVGNEESSPEGTAFVLKELAAEKERYEEERRALLEKIEPRRAPTAAAAAGAASTPPPSTPPAPETPPEPSPDAVAAAPSSATGLSAELTDDQKSAAQTTVMWMDAVTLGTYDAPRRAADLYAPDGVLWGTEVYGPDDPLWGTVLELVRNTPEQIYAYYDHFARLPKLRVVEYTPGPVRVHGDFAAQDGAHRFSWQGVDGSTVEMRARFSLTFRRIAPSGDDDSGNGSGDGSHPWEIVEHCSFSMPTAPPAGELTLKEVGSKAAAAATDDDITGDITKKHHRQQQRRQQKPHQNEQQQQQQRAGAEISAAAAQAITTAPSSPLVSPSLQVAADAVTPDGSSASVRDSAPRPPHSPSTFFSDSTTAAATKAAAASKAAAATKAAGSQGYWSFILNRYVWKPKALLPSAGNKQLDKQRRQGDDDNPALAPSSKQRIDELKQRAEIAEIRAAELASLLAKERAAIRRAVQQTRAAAPRYMPQPPQRSGEEQKDKEEEEEEEEEEKKEPKEETAVNARTGAKPAGGEQEGLSHADRSSREQDKRALHSAATANSATASAAMATATAATATATAATATATAATATATAATATATAANASAAAQGERGARRSSRASAAQLGERVEKARYLAAELAKQMREIEQRAASLAECDRVVEKARSSSSTGIVHGGSLNPSLDEQHPKMLV